MKSLYITSVERFSGKTATCLAIGRALRVAGRKVGYLKPLSLQPWRLGGHLADEDAAFVKQVLELPQEPWDLSPVVVTPEVLRGQLTNTQQVDLLPKVQAAFNAVAVDMDVVLLEGGGSLREGYVMGLPTPRMATAFGSEALAIVRYRDPIRLLDDALAAKLRLGEQLIGILVNRVPSDQIEFIQQEAIPYLRNHGVEVFGVLPEVRSLAALSVSEIIDVLYAEVLTHNYNPDTLIETLTIGAMTAEVALRRFRQQVKKAVITGGDRTDIQLAALETSTSCLILTGNLRPSPLVIKQANEFNIPVLLVRTNTIDTVDKMEHTVGKTRLGLQAKLAQFEQLLGAHVDLPALFARLAL